MGLAVNLKCMRANLLVGTHLEEAARTLNLLLVLDIVRWADSICDY